MSTQKSIIYATISRKDVVLCEETLGTSDKKSTGNFAQITQSLLTKFPPQAKHNFHYDSKYDFSVLNQKGIAYVAMTDRDMPLRIVFNFLTEMAENFTATYGDRAKTAQAFAMSDFSSTIGQLMKKWNDPNADAATRVQQKLDAVKGVMIDNIDKIIDRGEKLDIIVDKTDALADTADLFRSDAQKLKCEMLKQKLKLYGIIAAIIIVIILIIVIANSGYFVCCKQGKVHSGS